MGKYKVINENYKYEHKGYKGSIKWRYLKEIVAREEMRIICIQEKMYG